MKHDPDLALVVQYVQHGCRVYLQHLATCNGIMRIVKIVSTKWLLIMGSIPKTNRLLS